MSKIKISNYEIFFPFLQNWFIIHNYQKFLLSSFERLNIEKVLQNRYQIVDQLGRGGMGAVYRAKDLRFDDSYVALKKITIEFEKLDEKQQKLFKSAFEREANLLAKLSHESIPRVTDYFSESDSQYLVMELVDGEDLGALLSKNKKTFSFDEVLEWSFQILDALDYLHNQQPPIIHRDLKPANLKLTTRGKIKLLDFGIAKGNDGKSGGMTTVTSHTFVGATLNYSPIEQLFRVIDPNYREFILEKFTDKATAVFHQNADTRSDTFAFGATFYHLVTGQLPNDALKRALDVWGGKPDPLINPSHINPDIAPEIGEVLVKSLSTDVEMRFASAKEMSNALHEAIAAVKARKAKGKTKKNNALVDLSNLPVPVNIEATQPFFPQQMDLGEKTQIEPIINVNVAETQVDPITNSSPTPLEPEVVIQDTQIEQKPVTLDTQLNPVTFTQEPKFDSATITDSPANNVEITRLPIESPNADLTGISLLEKSLSDFKPTEAKTEQFKVIPEPQKEKELTTQPGGFFSSLSQKNVVALVSTAGVGIAVLSACFLGIMLWKPAAVTDDKPSNRTNVNYVTPTESVTPKVVESVTPVSSPNSNQETNTQSKTTVTPKPKVDKPQQEEKPVVAPTKVPVVAPTKAKPEPTKKVVDPRCVVTNTCN